MSQVLIFDARRVRSLRSRAFRLISHHDFLRQEVQAQLFDRLQDTKHTFKQILAVGFTGEDVPKKLQELPQTRGGQIVFGDVSYDWARGYAKNALSCAGVVFGEESLPFQAKSFDLFISVLSFHWLNDPLKALLEIRRVLRPDGLALVAFLGGRTLYELRQCLLEAEIALTGGACARVAPMTHLADGSALLHQSGLALPVIDRVCVSVTYGSLRDLLRDLRGMGEGNGLAQAAKSAPRDLFAKAEDLYFKNFSTSEGRLTATFEVIYFSGWAPAATQPKPLAPGSATHALADFL